MWLEKGWKTVRDYLKYYNTQEVIPLLMVTLNYAKQLSEKKVDMNKMKDSSIISDFMDTSTIMECTRWRPHCKHRIKAAN